MNRLLKTITAAALLIGLCSCSPKQMTIKGTIENHDGSEIMILDAKSDFGAKTIAVDEDGTFSFTYDAGTQHQIILIYSETMAIMLVQNGISSTIEISTAGEPQLIFAGDNRVENEYLNTLNDLYSLTSLEDEYDDDGNLLREGKTYNSFSEYEAAIDKKAAELSAILKRCKDGDFAKKEAITMQQTVINGKNGYLVVLESMDSDPDYNAYMRSIDLDDIENARNGMIKHYYAWLSKLNGVAYENMAIGYMSFINDSISAQEVKDYLSTQEMKELFMMPDKVTEEIFELYKKICKNETDMGEIAGKFNQLVSLLKGNPAPDFEMKDIDGNVVKLSDFKGKVVYVDFWASWCVFCCEEIPFLKEVYKKYEGNRKLEIISVSFDNNLDDWKTAMDEYEQPWKQYVADDELHELISEKYMISGIPHFLLIDAAGNLISFSAPAPSDEYLIELIEENI